MTDYRLNEKWRFELTKKRVITGSIKTLSGSKITVLTKFGEEVRFDDSEVLYSAKIK